MLLYEILTRAIFPASFLAAGHGKCISAFLLSKAVSAERLRAGKLAHY